MRNIIITGGLGFIGSNLSDFLLKKKYKVLNIDKGNYASNLYNIKKFRNHKNYKFIKNDLSDSKKYIKLLIDINQRVFFILLQKLMLTDQ